MTDQLPAPPAEPVHSPQPAPDAEEPAGHSSRKPVAALVCGIFAVLLSPTIVGGIVLGVIATVLGGVALKRQQRRGLAVGGLATGLVGAALAVVFIALVGSGGFGLQEELAAATEAQESAEETVAELEGELEDVERELASAETRAEEAEATAQAEMEDELESRRAELEDELESRRAEMESELADREQALEGRASELEERAEALDRRESQIAQAEERAEKSTFGSGVWAVGQDVLPGQYRAADASRGCYWARLTQNGDDIIDNHLSGEAGPVIATVRAGELFETSGCGQWHRVG